MISLSVGPISNYDYVAKKMRTYLLLGCVAWRNETLLITELDGSNILAILILTSRIWAILIVACKVSCVNRIFFL